MIIDSHKLLHFQAFFFVTPQLKRKSARVAALEKQLQEKTSAYSQVALKNTELENQLLVQHTHTCFSHINFDCPQTTDRHEEGSSGQIVRMLLDTCH